MATPEEVYKSEVYKSAAVGGMGNSVPLAWFQDVYEALGEALKKRNTIQDIFITCSNCGVYHSIFTGCPQKQNSKG